MGRDAGGGDSNTPQSVTGSAYLNDVYLRSIGKWVSQMAGSSVLAGTLCGKAVNDTMWGSGWHSYANCNGSPVWAGCPAGYTFVQSGYDQYSGTANYFYSCAKS